MKKKTLKLVQGDGLQQSKTYAVSSVVLGVVQGLVQTNEGVLYGIFLFYGGDSYAACYRNNSF